MAEQPANVALQVCYVCTERQLLLDCMVEPGTTIQQAIERSGIVAQAPEIDISVWRVGIYGKVKSLDTVVREHDRIEIYRPLIADPKESRRRRANKSERNEKKPDQ